MPRSRGGPARPAPSRPTASAPSRPAPQQQQTRPMSTTAPTRPGQQAPPQGATQSQGSGLFGQMASTAAGVAVGSSIGHAIGGFFGGGSSAQAPPAEQTSYDSYASTPQNGAMDSSLYNTNATNAATQQGPCATDIKNFTSCMENNKGDLNICGWYMEQLKACQAASRNY